MLTSSNAGLLGCAAYTLVRCSSKMTGSTPASRAIFLRESPCGAKTDVKSGFCKAASSEATWRCSDTSVDVGSTAPAEVMKAPVEDGATGSVGEGMLSSPGCVTCGSISASTDGIAISPVESTASNGTTGAVTSGAGVYAKGSVTGSRPVSSGATISSAETTDNRGSSTFGAACPSPGLRKWLPTKAPLRRAFNLHELIYCSKTAGTSSKWHMFARHMHERAAGGHAIKKPRPP